MIEFYDIPFRNVEGGDFGKEVTFSIKLGIMHERILLFL